MIDVNKLLNTVLAGDPASRQGNAEVGLPVDRSRRAGLGDYLSSNVGALGTGALAGGLAGTLLTSKHARKLGGSALQIGAVALLGGLAYKAYSNYRDGKPLVPQTIRDALGGLSPQQAGAAQPASGGLLSPPSALPADSSATLLLRAMIASAMADGRLDETERSRLIERVEASALPGEERHFLESLIAHPDTPEQLAAAANSPEEAAQVYLAAFIAIDADTPAEAAWLDDLANKLGLDPLLRRNIEAAGRGTA
ncbi:MULTISPECIES: tellurite resistance TerB family protein [Hyphomicrobiales]|jgi:uncharacterized membrane protein YebE (DUF533 family)|uniref:Uncharacterized membrane protein YebE (DUF533 family) n=2 Tax=Pseudomonadota TaxID=1224 RepID=A0ABV2N334_9HYPH|nr:MULTISPECIES: tellurite resistance TerB family protein [Hyphomicrobiales]MCA3572034.1 tellurite resistance TerB family protein [Bradyrhizobium sp.]MCA3580512.1 tellurite resistance TerB family protein [Bradyrhizobium sp.]